MILSKIEDQFLEEMKQSLERDYHEFCGYQETMTRTLEAFHKVCIQYDIPYYLAYGSLLGAIRDGGQIPWDYDIDVWVPYECAHKLMDALDQELSEKYHYTTRFKDPMCRTYTLKLAPKEYDCEVLHVDVFWMIGMPEQEEERVRLNKVKEKYFNICMIKYCDEKYLGLSGMVDKLMHKLRKLKYSFYSAARLEKLHEQIVSIPCSAAKMVSDQGNPWSYDREWFGKPKVIKTVGGLELCVPQNPEAVLKARYGDYEAYLPVEARIDEFQRSLRRIRALAKPGKK